MSPATPLPGCCHECALRPLCLPAGLRREELRAMTAVLRRRTPLAAGEHLFWAGDPFEALYAVRSGSIKTYTTDIDGQERIRGFHLPGDLFALDAIDSAEHPTSAAALSATEICVLPFARLERLAARVPSLLHRLLALMSRDLATAQALAGEFTAEQRVAAFLTQLAQRGRHAGGPADRLVLDMSRRDIGNYLRLVTETVSRVLTRFRDEGLIAVQRHEIRILDAPGLARLGEPVDLARHAGLGVMPVAA